MRWHSATIKCARCSSHVASFPEPPLPHPSDATLDRTGTHSRKWEQFGDAVPLWVADMDFRAPRPIIDAVRSVADHGVYGYTGCPPALAQAAVARLNARYGFGGLIGSSLELEPRKVLWLPGLLPGLNHVVRARRGALACKLHA